MPEILNKYTEIINTRLKELLDLKQVHPVIKDAMNYSVMAGGKRSDRRSISWRMPFFPGMYGKRLILHAPLR